METLHRCCAGLDVHKDTVVACVRRLDARGRLRSTTRTFGTMTAHLLALADWLADAGVTHVAMESTGVYWKPVWHLLEGRFELLVVNALHVKQVPGRKTDVQDCQWIAQLLQHGLLKASFVPERPIRELRDLVRQRAQLVAEQSAAANRVQKVLEDANIKLGSVASDVLGVSGRAMLDGLIAGQTDPGRLAEHAKTRLRRKLPELRLALTGRVTEHHRFLLRLHLEHWDRLAELIGRLSERIEASLAPHRAAVERLTTIPGIDVRTAEVIVAEVGPDMGRFPTAAHLASWAGVCPGNNESAGKRRGGRTRKGSRWLRTALVQAGWAAGRTRATYLGSQFRRLSVRRGAKRAVFAVAHTLLGIVYHVLRDGVAYRELGADWFDRLKPEQVTRRLVQRLERLGHTVTLTPATQA
jgi:transposase